ncbi:hypothetical protein PoB_002985800 [Plakobranchus ocellatus]|uniref:Uncharacterized protein n=1 Tax=Plakobranchus ocellatus TaxID=259542 RepID=A0AAV4A7Z7_9GAST|nr:hypothetical protein PoB_002985800 [Plakobranchus ocellatus]
MDLAAVIRDMLSYQNAFQKHRTDKRRMSIAKSRLQGRLTISADLFSVIASLPPLGLKMAGRPALGSAKAPNSPPSPPSTCARLSPTPQSLYEPEPFRKSAISYR